MDDKSVKGLYRYKGRNDLFDYVMVRRLMWVSKWNSYVVLLEEPPDYKNILMPSIYEVNGDTEEEAREWFNKEFTRVVDC